MLEQTEGMCIHTVGHHGEQGQGKTKRKEEMERSQRTRDRKQRLIRKVNLGCYFEMVKVVCGVLRLLLFPLKISSMFFPSLSENGDLSDVSYHLICFGW